MAAADLAANIVIGSSATVAALTLLDWALTDKQKKILTDKAISLWVWLEDERSLDYLKKFKDYREQWRISAMLHSAIAGGFGLLALVGIGLSAMFDLNIAEVSRMAWVALGAALAAVINVFWLHPILLSWVTKGQSGLVYLLKSTICAMPFIVVIRAFPDWVSAGFGEGWGPFLSVQPLEGPISNVAFGFFSASGSVLLYFWYINLFLVSLRWISYPIFGFGRFILVRIVDNPKGLVLGLSGLVGCIGALFKAFAGK